MTAPARAAMLTWGALRPNEQHLLKILDFLAVPHMTIDLRSADATAIQPGELRPIVSAATVRHALAAGTPATDRLRTLVAEATTALIHGVTPDTVSARELSVLMPGSARPIWVTPAAGTGYRIDCS